MSIFYVMLDNLTKPPFLLYAYIYSVFCRRRVNLHLEKGTNPILPELHWTK